MAAANGDLYVHKLRQAKRRILLGALRETRGNRTLAAIRLGIHRNTMTHLMREVGMDMATVKRHLALDAFNEAAMQEARVA